MTVRLVGLTVVAAATLSSVPSAQAPRGKRLLNTTVDRRAELRLPPTSRNIGYTLATLAKSTGALIGFETVMEDEPTTVVPTEFGWSPRGLTLKQALDQVVALDPRYGWREHRGVIHVRPKTAFRDRKHFLNQRVRHFKLNDALPLHATFEVHRVYRPNCEIRHPIYTSERDRFLSAEPGSLRQPLSVALNNVTVLDVLDGVIKAHGQLYWNLTYRVPPDEQRPKSPRYEHAIFSFHDRPALGGWWRMCNNETYPE